MNALTGSERRAGATVALPYGTATGRDDFHVVRRRFFEDRVAPDPSKPESKLRQQRACLVRLMAERPAFPMTSFCAALASSIAKTEDHERRQPFRMARVG